MRNFSGALYIVNVKEDVNHTSIVQFTQLITNTAEAVALNYNTRIIRKMKNFDMKPTFQGSEGCDASRLSDNAFETTQFLERNIIKTINYE